VRASSQASRAGGVSHDVAGGCAAGGRRKCRAGAGAGAGCPGVPAAGGCGGGAPPRIVAPSDYSGPRRNNM
jgi:hypothetical protein